MSSDVSCNSTELTATKPNLNIHSASGNQQISSSSSEIDCIRCKELEHALLRASSAVPADKLQNDCEKRYCIPKEKYDLLIAAMKNSQQFCSVIFDIEGTLVYAEPDISSGDDGI